MPASIPESIREQVIQRRILCESFNKIAKDLGISHGVAVNIEKQWRIAIGENNAQAILDLSRSLDRLGISAADSFVGSRIWITLKAMGVKPETANQLLSSLAGEVMAKGIPLDSVADKVLQLTQLSQKFHLSSIEHVPDTVENACKILFDTEAQIANTTSELKKAQTELQMTLDEMNTTRENSALFVKVEAKLNPLGLSFANVDGVINVVNNVKELGSDPAKIVSAFSPLGTLEEKKVDLETEIQFRQESLAKIEHEIASRNAKLAELHELQATLNEWITLGFEKSNLLDLVAVVKKVSLERKILPAFAASTFVTEVEAGYDTVLGFRAVATEMERQLRQESEKLGKIRKESAELTDCINALEFLTGKNVQEKDIVYWQKVFRDHPTLSPEALNTSLRDYADLAEAITIRHAIYERNEDVLRSLKGDVDRLKAERVRVIGDIEHARKTVDEYQMQFIERQKALIKQEGELLIETACGVVQEEAKKALLYGISLKAADSPLRPILLWENGGPDPLPSEIQAAEKYLLGVRERFNRQRGLSNPSYQDMIKLLSDASQSLKGNGDDMEQRFRNECNIISNNLNNSGVFDIKEGNQDVNEKK